MLQQCLELPTWHHSMRMHVLTHTYTHTKSNPDHGLLREFVCPVGGGEGDSPCGVVVGFWAEGFQG